MHVKKGMLVKVVSGNHKGMEGKILNVFPKKNKVIVEGVNFRRRATRPSQESPSGGFVEREAPLHISNVMVVNNGTATRVGFKVLDDGTKIRISKKTEEEIQF
tara:strand:+ start:706 stop:1014 length:309 start_codon:yes stop_codon:yes gene_type:complete